MAVIFHTSDWHVGKGVGRLSREQDQRAVLAEIVAQAEAAEPDLIIHSGDVFDGFRPATSDMRLALGTLQSLGTIAPTVVIVGNHDSPALFDVFSLFAGQSSSRVRFVTRARHPREGGILDFEVAGGSQRLRLACMPFVHPNRQVDWFDDPRRFMGQYAAKLQAMNSILREGLEDGYDPARDVLLYTGHVHIAGAHLSGTERPLHVTDTYAAEASSLPRVSYSALGHIHKPQQVPGTSAYYVGSAMQLDFGEAGQDRSSIVVAANPGRPAEVTRVYLTSPRKLRVLSGAFDVVREEAATVDDDLVRVIVQTEDPIPGLADILIELMPRATIVDITENVASQRLQILDPEAFDQDETEPTFAELLDSYLQTKGTHDAGVSAERLKALFVAMSAQTDDEEDPEIDGLGAVIHSPLPDPPQLEIPG